MKKSLKPLTSLRFIAAAMIVVHHSRSYFGYGTWLGTHFRLDAGVDFFYVLSGFILFYSYRDLSGPRAICNFYVARIARIWPLHFATWLMVLVFLPAPWGPPGNPFTEAAANLLLLQAWIPKMNYFFSFNAVSWSLSVEAFFYLMFPFLTFRWKHTWWWKLALAAGLAILTITWAVHLPPGQLYNGMPVDPTVFIFPPSRLFEFALGMAFCLMWLNQKRNLEKASVWTLSGFETASVLLVIMMLRWITPTAHHLYDVHRINASEYRWIVQCSCAPAMGILILIMATGGGMISRFLSYQIPVILGEISFSIYMMHQIIIRVFSENRSLSEFGGSGAQYLAFWIFIIILSFLLWEFIEKPCRHRLVHFLSVPSVKFPTS